jgi:hypothetical protein
VCVRALGFGPVEVEATTNWLRMVVADVTAVEEYDFAAASRSAQIFRNFLFNAKKALP